MSQKRSGLLVWKGLFYLPALGGVLVMACAMAYCWLNKAGHSSLDLRGGWVVFGPLLVIGLGFLARGDRRAGSVSVAVGLPGMGFGYFVHHLGIMQEYNFWASQSLAPKNPYSGLLLASYGVLLVVVLAMALKKRRVPKGPECEAEVLTS